MGQPAARIGDSTAHGTLAGPGPGAANVLIGGRAAWRCAVDAHGCVVPPPLTPHGVETCVFGSVTVLVNGQMAVRAGDALIGSGAPNAILGGCSTVLIGDAPFGLLGRRALRRFRREMERLLLVWDAMSVHDRCVAMQGIVNAVLDRIGVPPLAVRSSSSLGHALGSYNTKAGVLSVSSKIVRGKAATIGPPLGEILYHEARHAEHGWYQARFLAGKGYAPDEIAELLDIPPQRAKAAAKRPLRTGSPEARLGEATYESIYGDGAERRAVILRGIRDPTNYEQYRALPEEVDAWRAGGERLPSLSGPRPQQGG